MTGEQPSLSIARYPGPACTYRITDGTPVVHSTNDAFETQFGTDVEGKTIPALFETLGFRTREDAASLSSCVKRGDQFEVRATHAENRHNGTYLVQTVTPEEGKPGFLFFVEPSAHAEDSTAGTLGIDHVASVVSHDLRNPLDVARARLEAGRELNDDEHFDHVEQAHERMERIIQDVLTIARGSEVVDPDDTVDLTDVAESAWETVETDGATLQIDGQLPTVTADPDRVGRLFENLFRNCVEHGSTSTRARPDDAAVDGSRYDVAVTVGPLEGDGRTGFYVADDGPGIPPEDRQHVFDPGYSSEDHGTGLGLAIVARIVDLHGWSIGVTESASGGARFEIDGIETSE